MRTERVQALYIKLHQLGSSVSGGHVGAIGRRHVFESEPEWKLYRGVVDALQRTSPWRERLTRTEIESYVNDLISFQASGQTAEQFAAMLATMEEALESQGERLFVLPVTGLFLFGDRLRLGSVTFLQITRDTLGTLSEECTARVMPSHRAGARQLLGEELTHLMDTTVALLSGPHLTARLRQETVLEARTALHVLRAAVVMTHENPWAVHLAVSGDERGGWHQGIEIAPLGVDLSARPLDGGLGEDFTVLSEHRRDLTRLGLDAVAHALDRPSAERTPWQVTLLRAYHWIGNAQLQPDADAALLCLIIALETLFAPGPQGITGVIADSVALLTRERPQEREERARTVTRLYGLRSRVAHGSSQALQWDDVHLLRIILRDVMMALTSLSKEWTDRAELDQHVRALKYSTP